MSDYTPTTSEILEAFAWDDKYDELSVERIDMFYRWLSKIKEEVSTKAHFEHWVAEIKAEAVAQFIDDTGISLDAAQSLMAKAWEEGLEAKFKLLEGQDSVSLDNPYLQGEKIILSNNDFDQLRKALDEE